jgi:signal transduction histidine kinase/FixJ family two-component response regulator
MVVDGAGVFVARTRNPEQFFGRKAAQEFLDHTAAGGSGVFRYRTVDGMDACVAFARAPLSGWTVAVVASAAAVDAPVRRSIQALAAAAIALVAFSAIAAFLASRRFSAAIGSLTRAAAALPHGGRVEVTPHRITEVSQVGEALDRSARLLEARQREAEENLARAAAARAEAESSNRAKDEFLAMLGHELRNPLSPIVTALQLLRQRGLRWGREHDIISRQVSHLVRLVDDLLDVSRVTRGKIELHPERMELRTAVARAIEMASPVIEERQHRLSVDVPEGLVVRADPARLAQVITNLLTNAARYTPRRGHVAVTARREADGISLSVSDDGQGIAPELLPRIFELFVQGPRARDRAEGGLGIGLALVRTLVSLHGGRVEAHSEGPGRGSTFRMVLPDAADAPDMAATGGAGDPLRRTATPLRILVVDDNADAAMLLTEFLSQVGHEVVPAHDAPAALAAVERFSPDLAILDIGLPVIDGYELAEQLREKLGASAPAFVGLTGYGQASDHTKSREAGFVRHFVKPIDPGELLDALEEIATARSGGKARPAAAQASADAAERVELG